MDRVGGGGTSGPCPGVPHRHPHLHGPLGLAAGRRPAAGRLPRLHPRGAHQQRAAGLQGPPAAGAGGVAGLQVLHRVPARPVPPRGEGQRGVRVSPGLDRPAVRPGGPGPLPRPQVSVPRRKLGGLWSGCRQGLRPCECRNAQAPCSGPAVCPAHPPLQAREGPRPSTRPVARGGFRPYGATVSLCGQQVCVTGHHRATWQIFIEGLLCAWPCGKQERPSSSVLTPEPRLELGGC